jgi:hypothetical protein
LATARGFFIGERIKLAFMREDIKKYELAKRARLLRIVLPTSGSLRVAKAI